MGQSWLFTIYSNEFIDQCNSDYNITWGWNDNKKNIKRGFFLYKNQIKNKKKYILVVISGNIVFKKFKIKFKFF